MSDIGNPRGTGRDLGSDYKTGFLTWLKEHTIEDIRFVFFGSAVLLIFAVLSAFVFLFY